MSQSSALIALQLLMQNIAQGNSEDVVKYLNLIDIPTLSPEKADSLLARLVTTAAEYNAGAIVRVIISAFEPNFTDRYRLPLLNQILMDQRFEDDIVAFVLRQYPEVSYFKLAQDFVKWDADPDIMAGLVRLDDIRGSLDIEEYRELYKLSRTQEYSNNVASDFFAYQLDQKSDYAEIPTWIRNFTEEETLPYEDELVLPESGPFIFDVPETIEEVVDILTAGLEAAGRSQEDVELAQMELRKRLVGATREEKAAYLQDAFENKAKVNLADDDDLFAILGPANAIVDSDLADDESICYNYGGCRMLCCIEFEDFLNPDEEIIYDRSEYSQTEWFKGACQVCHLRIRRPAHALRMPLEHGGWKGCYCSETCLRKDIDEDNLLIWALLDQVIADLNRIGIQDRLPVSEREVEEPED